MNEKVKRRVRDALCLDNNVSVSNVYRAGGMTNFNYFATIETEDYIVRLPGHGTEELVNRRTEKANLEFASALGINPDLIYFNVDSGMKITKKVEGAQPLTPELGKHHHIMKAVAGILRTLHQSEKKMSNEFKLFDLMDHYKNIVRDVNLFIIEKYEVVEKAVADLKSRFQMMDQIAKTSCHIDPIYNNFLIDNHDNIYLIDWEYSGMFDPLWDVAAFSLECRMTDQEERIFLNAYFQRGMTEEEMQRLLMHKIFQDYLWSLWTFYKESQGDDFGSYGMFRLKRAEENIQLFESTINETDVG